MGRSTSESVRKDARDAIATYLRNLVLLVFLCGGSLGVLVAFAVRGGATPKLRYTSGTAVATALLTATALVVLLPPRGPIDKPQYYAFGPDIPRALEAVETAQRSTRALDQELDAQLVGLARLVTAPANRPALEDRPRLTLASDLHNNVLALPILERTAARGPVFFAGDLTDRGSPLEAALVRRVVRTGKPFVFVPGNHDSDTLARAARPRRRDRAHPHGPAEQRRRHDRRAPGDHGRRAAGRRLRRPVRAPRPARTSPTATTGPRMRRRSSASRRGCAAIRDEADIVMVHNPALIATALDELDADPRRSRCTILVGHTHHAELTRRPGATVINAGTVGAGGTGNLLEREKIGIARLSYETKPSFEALAVDMVTIDPRSGSATARRERLDEAAPDPDA